jgi:hypothetical protein
MQTLNWKQGAIIMAGMSLLLAGTARAEDSFAPCWRGNAGTTYENWSFPSAASPTAPAAYNNPNGTPLASLTVGSFGTGWRSSTPLGNRTNVWDLGEAGQASLSIANFGGSTNSWEYVQVQVTCFVAGSFYAAPTISIPGATLISSQSTNNQTLSLGSWETIQSVWLIQPSPTSESIIISGSPTSGFLLNQIVVDTRCPVGGDSVPAYRPCWRGLTGSTYQQWSFGVSNTPAAIPAELITNIYGTPVADLVPGEYSSGYISQDSFLGCVEGIWDLGEYGTLTLNVPNVPSASSGSYKYVQVQVTQYRDSEIYTTNASVAIANGVEVSDQQQVLFATTFGEWVVDNSLWRVTPSPATEAVVVTGLENGSLIHQVTLDTLSLDFPTQVDLTLPADPGDCSTANVNWTTLPAVDGCVVKSVVCTPPLGSTFEKGTTPVNVVIIDGEGGTKTYGFHVTVKDTQPPVVTPPANMMVARTPGQCGANVSFTPTATDNCGIASIVSTPPSGSEFPLGFSTVTSVAYDTSGNASTPGTFTIQVVDFTGDLPANHPCWRGNPASTFQQWAFSVDTNPAAILPELATNSFGTPSASIAFGPYSSGYINEDSFLGCAQGIWDLGEYGTLSLTIPNAPSAPANAYQYVQVQVTQYRDPSIYTTNASVTIAGGSLVNEHQQTLQNTTFGEWVVDTTVWRLAPSLAAGTIQINAGDDGALIDQVAVDTINLQFASEPSQTVNLAAGLCSTNVSWVTPAVDGCTNRGVVSYLNGLLVSSPLAFVPGVTTVSVVITDAESAKVTNNFTVTVTDSNPPVFTSVAATEVQPYVGTINVLNGAAPTVQGTVNFAIQASVKACAGAPVVTLTNGVNNATANYVNVSPAGTYNYAWAVTPTTANGTWTATATAFDAADTATTNFTLVVNVAQITGQVELDSFDGSGTVPPHTRAVTFVATSNDPVAGTTVLQSWTLTLSNDSGDTFNYVLTGVPANANGLSAKTDWNLRRKLSVVLDASEQGVANFTGSSLLLGGDVNGDNIVNAFDYNVLENNWFLVAPVADIVGYGTVNTFDYNILENNWFIAGDPQ